MNAFIYNPLEEYENTFKTKHADNTKAWFDDLTARSGVNVAENRQTVKDYELQKAAFDKLSKKISRKKTWRVLLIIAIVILAVAAVGLIVNNLILPFVGALVGAIGLLLLLLLVVNPAIKRLKEPLAEEQRKTQALLDKAKAQMQPLCALLRDEDAIHILEKTISNLDFLPRFSAEQEADMVKNYDFYKARNREHSSLDVLSGRYNGNPFLFEKRLVHRMGMEVYHGYKTIHWTETYVDSKGKLRTRSRSQTLHATVTKPKPFYHTETVLYYGAQGGPELSFSRAATRLEQKSDRQIERYIKRGERKLEKMDDESIRQSEDFVSMSNTEFEVLFGALDRTHEVQFRTLFTPLAQTNLVDLILSETAYEDDFHFTKRGRMNEILSEHAQARPLVPVSSEFASHDYDVIRDRFTQENNEYFRSIYFTFAPLWSIPVYQERPVHSLHPIGDLSQKYSLREYEVLANTMDAKYATHPKTKTQAIFKSEFLKSAHEDDAMRITAYSYDEIPRVDVVPMLGGDGRMHGVPVPWKEYLPLEAQTDFLVSDTQKEKSILARRHGLFASNYKS